MQSFASLPFSTAEKSVTVQKNTHSKQFMPHTYGGIIMKYGCWSVLSNKHRAILPLGWHSGAMVWVSDLQSRGRGFDPQLVCSCKTTPVTKQHNLVQGVKMD